LVTSLFFFLLLNFQLILIGIIIYLSFQILTPEGSYYFSAPAEDVRDEWLSTLFPLTAQNEDEVKK